MQDKYHLLFKLLDTTLFFTLAQIFLSNNSGTSYR